MTGSCGVQSSGTIELYFYGELPFSEREAFEAHLAACSQCRAGLEDLAVIRTALASRPAVSAPPAGDWSGFMSRLARAVEQDAGRPHGIRAARAPRSYAGYAAMAAVLALATIGITFASRSRSVQQPQAVANVAAGQPRVERGRAGDEGFAALSEEHFERSKLVVLGLTTKDAGRVTSADWTYERELASALLDDTRMYRLAAEDRGLQRLAGVMEDLELVLLQTSLAEHPDPASLAQIQRLIQKRDLLEKMDVVTSRGL
jgi:hypothetical protein